MIRKRFPLASGDELRTYAQNSLRAFPDPHDENQSMVILTARLQDFSPQLERMVNNFGFGPAK
jgi:hypothetical protein